MKQAQKKDKKTQVKVTKPRLRGKGDYTTADLNTVKHIDNRLKKLENPSFINSLATAAGAGLGGLVGAPELGALAGSSLARWMGQGDYVLRSNSLIQGVMQDTGATFMRNGRGDRIIHREFIGDIVSGGINTFTNLTYPINPGMSATFPWLSTVANNYEQYEPHGIVFEFISTSAVFSGTSQALGTAIMATDYDPTDPSYATKIEMESSDYANSARTSTNQVHGIECAPTERADRLMYVRSGGIGTESLKFYDLGSFQIATAGLGVANINIGELWVSYDISFYKKQLTQGQVGNSISYFNLVASVGLAAATPFGTNVKAGSLPLTLGLLTITFPSTIVTGRYFINYLLNGTTVSVPTFTYTSNCAIAPGSYTGTSAINPLASGAGNTSASYQAWFTITGPSAVITLSGGNFVGANYVAMSISQVPFASLTPF